MLLTFSHNSWIEMLRLSEKVIKLWLSIEFSLKCTFPGMGHELCHQKTYVTTAFGFFSTAYTRTFRPDSSPAASDALTRGPRPAPTTIITLRGCTWHLVKQCTVNSAELL